MFFFSLLSKVIWLVLTDDLQSTGKMSINEKLSILDWLIHMLLSGCLKLRAVGGNIP